MEKPTGNINMSKVYPLSEFYLNSVKFMREKRLPWVLLHHMFWTHKFLSTQFEIFWAEQQLYAIFLQFYSWELLGELNSENSITVTQVIKEHTEHVLNSYLDLLPTVSSIKTCFLCLSLQYHKMITFSSKLRPLPRQNESFVLV